MGDGPRDRCGVQSRSDILVYTSEPLEADVEGDKNG